MLCRLLHQRAWNEICQGNYAAADQKLESILNGTYVPEKAEAEPFASNPNLKSDISLTSLIVDVDAENMKLVPPPVPALSKCAN